jgi:hypothetical protein
MKKLFIIELLLRLIEIRDDLKKLEEAGIVIKSLPQKIEESIIRSIAFILTDKNPKVTEITMWINWWLGKEEKLIIEENFQIDLTNPEIFAEHLQKIAKK